MSVEKTIRTGMIDQREAGVPKPGLRGRTRRSVRLRPKLKILWRRPSWVQKRGNALKLPPPALQ